jgi:archaemetzincin
VVADQRLPADALGASLRASPENSRDRVHSPGAIALHHHLGSAGRHGHGKGSPPGGLRRSPAFAEAPLSRSRLTLEARFKRRALFAVVDESAAHRSADAGHDRLGEPEEGDWLYHVRERGQTFDEFQEAQGHGRNRFRHTLHLVPLGTGVPVSEELVETVREHTALYFGVNTEVLQQTQVPARFFDPQRQRYDADALARELSRGVPRSSLGVLGLLGADLHGLGLDYVFGLGLLRDRAGVFSTFRYRTDDSRRMIQRVLKVASHEIGHLLGLKHCVFYRCLMNGSNSVEEMDQQPLHVCPVCQAKLGYALGFNPRTRARGLNAFYERVGLVSEARFMTTRLARLPGPATSPAVASSQTP